MSGVGFVWVLRIEGRTLGTRYSTIWEAPEWGTSSWYYTIDRDRWTIPLYAVVVVTIGFYKLFESKKNNGGE